MSESIPKVVEVMAPFGALVTGVDFRNPSEAQTAAIKQILTQHHLILSRDHAPPDDTQIENFFREFGELSSNTPEVKAHFERLAKLVPEYVEGGKTGIGTRFNLSNVEEKGVRKGGLGNRELTWHNDQADLPRLKTLSCLEALEFESGAGNTFFCDMYTAADTLPASLRKQLEGVSALHDSSNYRSDTGANIATAPAAAHPILLAHPETGRRCLYVNESFTSQVVGLSAEESAALITRLRDHAYQPRFIYEHHWKTGDLLIWDNVGLQHMRPSLDSSKKRTLRVFQGVSESFTIPSEFLPLN